MSTTDQPPKSQPHELRKPSTPDESESLLRAVDVCFVPRAVASNTLANLQLVGTICKFGDSEYRRISELTCDLYFPAGTFIALDDGCIAAVHTWSDIGQLDLAFNDYLNFLMDLRRIYETNSSYIEKVAAIEHLALGTGRQGHSHGFFVSRHGGAERLLSKCPARKK